MKPDPVLNTHDLVVSPTLMIASSSKSDLVDLNTTATMLVGKDEKASDPVSEVDESANLVGDEDVTMKLLNTDEVEPHTVTQALKDPKWLVAMSAEFDALVNNVT